MEHPDLTLRQSLMEISVLACFPMALRTAIELRVFEIIAEGGPGAELSPPEMVAKMPTTNPDATAAALDLILQNLAAHSILTIKEPNDGGTGWRLYGLTPKSLCLVAGEHGPSFAPLVHYSLLKPTLNGFDHLGASILEGGAGATPFKRAHGIDIFDYAGKDQQFSGLFHEAMSVIVSLIMANVFEIYQGFKDVKEIVDVAGGNGTCISLIVEKFPQIRGVNYDLPYVIARAPQYPGVEHVAGDMFEAVPTAGTIFMRGILHNWGDEKCLTLLRNCWKALPADGKVIAVEYVIPPVVGTDQVSRFTTGLSMLIMSNFNDGKERKASEYAVLAKAAGFVDMKVFPASMGIAIMEFHKSLPATS